MECSCTVDSGYDGEAAEFCREVERKARKSHKCGECRRVINPGENYTYYVGKWDGEIGTHKMCSDCRSVVAEFFRNSFVFETIWEELSEHINSCEGDIPENCMLEVTPAARAKIAELIQSYYNYADRVK